MALTPVEAARGDLGGVEEGGEAGTCACREEEASVLWAHVRLAQDLLPDVVSGRSLGRPCFFSSWPLNDAHTMSAVRLDWLTGS